MRVLAEFSTEPFLVGGEEAPPAHATAALQAAEDAGLSCDFGPLGTSVKGDAEVVLSALGAVMQAALSHGATRITLQVQRDGEDG